MALKNIIPISTSSGFKTIEVHHDDLTNLSWPLSVMVISAFRNGYHPTPGTVMAGLLQTRNLRIDDLADKPLIDLRESLDTWVSNNLNEEWCRYIVCLEGLSQLVFDPENLKGHLRNLMGTISLLSMKGVDVASVGMPLLGMGRQGMSMEQFLPCLLETCFEMLDKIKGLKTIYFVHNDNGIVEKIDDEINLLLNRNKDNLEFIRTPIGNNELIEVSLKKLFLIKEIIPVEGKVEVEQMIRNIENQKIRNSEFALSTRKVLEALLSDLTSNSNKIRTTNDLIKDLHNKNVSRWIISNFHLIRTFCNSFVHRTTDSIPNQHVDLDVKIFLCAFDRILSFYLESHATVKKSMNSEKGKKLDIE